jgi:hypothetical protein
MKMFLSDRKKLLADLRCDLNNEKVLSNRLRN